MNNYKIIFFNFFKENIDDDYLNTVRAEIAIYLLKLYLSTPLKPEPLATVPPMSWVSFGEREQTPV